MLETIAKYDNPELHGKSGLREYQSQKSKYCSTRTVKEEFDDLIRNADFQYIFLSYNNEGLMPFEVIREIMEQYGEYDVFTTITNVSEQIKKKIEITRRIKQLNIYIA